MLKNQPQQKKEDPKGYHTVSILGYPGAIQIYLDGKEIQGVQSVQLAANPGEAPRVKLTIVPWKLNISGIPAELIIEKDESIQEEVADGK